MTGIWSIQNGGKAESLLFCETFANGERERDNKWWRMSTFIRVRRGGLWKEWRKQEREKILLHINTRVGFFWAMVSLLYGSKLFSFKRKNRMTLFYFFLTGPWGGGCPSGQQQHLYKTAKDIAGWQQLSNVCEDSTPTVWYKMSSSPFFFPYMPIQAGRCAGQHVCASFNIID